MASECANICVYTPSTCSASWRDAEVRKRHAIVFPTKAQDHGVKYRPCLKHSITSSTCSSMSSITHCWRNFFTTPPLYHLSLSISCLVALHPPHSPIPILLHTHTYTYHTQMALSKTLSPPSSMVTRVQIAAPTSNPNLSPHPPYEEKFSYNGMDRDEG
ncbi:unnamed protein product [Periconia digitata]|uniref:Uncharacterized protein n=1 Tax=Periconia digitata TaxID=1303443 RepID=A0A9W4XRG6_9PLEO|nr:unnamed protein product [Periconia digitata]